MSDDYTPTTAQVLACWLDAPLVPWRSIDAKRAEFNRWLEAHDAEVRADQRKKDVQIVEAVIRELVNVDVSIVTGSISAGGLVEFRAGGQTPADARPGGES